MPWRLARGWVALWPERVTFVTKARFDLRHTGRGCNVLFVSNHQPPKGNPMTINSNPTILDTVTAENVEAGMTVLIDGAESFVIGCRKAGATVGLWVRDIVTGATSNADREAGEGVDVTWL